MSGMPEGISHSIPNNGGYLHKQLKASRYRCIFFPSRRGNDVRVISFHPVLLMDEDISREVGTYSMTVILPTYRYQRSLPSARVACEFSLTVLVRYTVIADHSSSTLQTTRSSALKQCSLVIVKAVLS